jgi:uncharacterized repeat protein (TIGR03943 family)
VTPRRVAVPGSTHRLAQAVVMLLLGGAVVRISLTGVYLRYVKSGLQPLLILAGVLLVAAAAMTLWYELWPHREPEHGPDGHDGGVHAHREPRVGWLLMLPALGLLLLTPSALGSAAADAAGSALTADNAPSDYAPVPAGDPAPLGLLDYASRAVFDGGKTLTGRTLELSGFLTPGPDGRPVLARMMLTCCAADARPIKVGLAGDVPDGVPADTWVRVVGRYVSETTQDPVNDAVVPYLEVTSWQPITAPREPYEIAQPYG